MPSLVKHIFNNHHIIFKIQEQINLTEHIHKQNTENVEKCYGLLINTFTKWKQEVLQVIHTYYIFKPI